MQGNPQLFISDTFCANNSRYLKHCIDNNRGPTEDEKKLVAAALVSHLADDGGWGWIAETGYEHRISVFQNAADTLIKIQPDAKEFFPAVLDALGKALKLDNIPMIQANEKLAELMFKEINNGGFEVLKGFALMGLDGQIVIPQFRRFLSDSDYNVTIGAIKLLGRIRTLENQKDVIDILKKVVIGEKDPYTAETANEVLQSIQGLPSFFKATLTGYPDLKEFIAKGADVNEKDLFGNTALLLLVKSKDKYISDFKRRNFETLVTNGADVNAKNKGGDTPLLLAAEKWDYDYVKLLLANKADVNVKDKNGRTVLLHLLSESFLSYSVNRYSANETIEMILAKGADVNVVDAYGDTPLLVALKKEKGHYVSLLLANKADVNVKDKNGDTPLLLAAKGNWGSAYVSLLLANKADVNVKDKDGYTPLLLAAKEGNKDNVRLLLANKADVNAKDKNGRTVLLHWLSGSSSYAIYWSYWGEWNDLDLIMTLAKGADVNAVDKNGNTALRYVKQELSGSLYTQGRERAQHILKLLQDAGAKDDAEKVSNKDITGMREMIGVQETSSALLSNVSDASMLSWLFGGKNDDFQVTDRSWKTSVLLYKLFDIAGMARPDMEFLRDKSFAWVRSSNIEKKVTGLNTLRYLFKAQHIPYSKELLDEIVTVFFNNDSLAVRLAALDFLGAMSTSPSPLQYLNPSEVKQIVAFRGKMLNKMQASQRAYADSGVQSDIAKESSGKTPAEALKGAASRVDSIDAAMFSFFAKKYGSLSDAVRSDDIKAVRKMLNDGTDPNKPASGDDANPIFYALHSGPQMVQLLIDHGADLNVIGRNGTTPLAAALSQGYNDVANVLRKSGAELISDTDEFWMDPVVRSKLKDDIYKIVFAARMSFPTDDLMEIARKVKTKVNANFASEYTALERKILEEEDWLLILDVVGGKSLVAEYMAKKPVVVPQIKPLSFEALTYGFKLDPQFFNMIMPKIMRRVSVALQRVPAASPDEVADAVERVLNVRFPDQMPVALQKQVRSEMRKLILTQMGVDPTVDRAMGNDAAMGVVNFSAYEAMQKIVDPFKKRTMVALMLLSVAGGVAKPEDVWAGSGNAGQTSRQTTSVKTDQKLLQDMLKASLAGDIKKVRALINRGIDVNAVDQNGGFALHAATLGGHAEIVKLLIEKGADVNMQSKNGYTALMLAAGDGRLEIVTQLLKNGADLNKQERKTGGTALILAVAQKHQETAKLLIASGADVNKQGEPGATALMGAVLAGNIEIAKLLLEKGADVNVVLGDGITPLMIAAENGYQEIVKALLDKGADINKQHNKYGNTALMQASTAGYPEIVRMLIERGADVNKQSRNGLTALMYAAGRGYQVVVRLLLENGADVNKQDDQGSTALMFTVEKGSLESIKLLLVKGADIRIKDRNGISAREIAARSKHKGIRDLFLYLGVTGPNKASDKAQTGGIDIKNIDVKKTGNARIQFDDQAVREVLVNGFNGFTPVILNITPMKDPLMALGIMPGV
ncbi:MAG: ankyrin repeat domain-containing protein [Candidatus Omnitrophica bacterium]|nr:ankyrin repeat domain-containing protein [Candidatus Omnitrophota bacterium]